VLGVAAFEYGDPVAGFVLMEADDLSDHKKGFPKLNGFLTGRSTRLKAPARILHPRRNRRGFAGASL
jgi:hypothetical protein